MARAAAAKSPPGAKGKSPIRAALAASPKGGRAASPRRASMRVPAGMRPDAYAHQAAEPAPVDVQLGELLDWEAKGVLQWEMQMLRGEI